MSRRVKGPVVLVVLDGWGLREETEHNGVALAKTPWFDHLTASYPFTNLQASGEAVGLPVGQIGNSEVGHTTIGAGCVLYQDLVRINKDVASGAFGKNEAFQKVFDHVRSNRSQLHILGLLSTGGVHSHEDHLLAAIRAARSEGIERIIVHLFLDGRDTPKTAGLDSLRKLEKLVDEIGNCDIGSVSGRYYAMDRDTNWDRTDKAFNAIFHGQADHIYDTSIQPSQIVQERYHQELYDEHFEPMVFKNAEGKVMQVQSGDGIVFTNFRKDRTRQLSQRICESKEDKNLCFVTMTKYGAGIEALVMYAPETVQKPLAEVISDAGLKQAHLAETEKFPHATYYINGGREEAYPGEEDVLVPSRKDVKTHDEAPEMRAKEICDEAIKRVGSVDYMFINFANPDMVGHTANEPAIITAIETVDRELKRLTEAVLAADGALVIIADHGNAETMVDPETKQPHTAHTLNPVPCLVVHRTYHPTFRSGDRGLKDVAPTVLELLGLEIPTAMTGKTLITDE